jgi:putative toxin-antitoxin system antitoxin component (TIGR02293 family)
MLYSIPTEEALLGIKGRRAGEHIRRGLPTKSVRALSTVSGMSEKELINILNVSDRNWRRRKMTGVLNRNESNTLFRSARVIVAVLGMTHGDTEKAQRWLRKPLKSLGGKTAIHCLETDADSQRVIDLVGQIREGVFS